MLTAAGNERHWCSVHTAVDGRMEVHLAEPARGWRRWRESPGERWLSLHGFVRVPDAWAAVAPRFAPLDWCVKTLTTAVADGLQVPDQADFETTLAFPGTVGEVAPPAPAAPQREHVRHALRSLAAQRSGKACFSGGAPSETWAWVFTVSDGLEMSPEPPGDPGEYDEDWTVGFEQTAVADAADKLIELLHSAHGRDRHAPLFISFMDS